jgi:vacuolar-type H+-ATPase subunit E/Vma4
MQRQINKLETILQDLLAETKTITRRLDHESRQIVDKSNKYITLVMQNADSNYKIDYSSSKRLASLNSNLERMGGLI